MKFTVLPAVSVIGAGLLASGLAVAPVAASASTSPAHRPAHYPGPAVVTNNGSWHLSYKPTHLEFYPSTPAVEHLHWSRYRHHEGVAKGRLLAQRDACLKVKPAFQCKIFKLKVKVTVSDPKSIQLGIRQDIFMRMHWAYTSHVGTLNAVHYWHVKIGGTDDGLWEPGK
jgi:hypothetical protein